MNTRRGYKLNEETRRKMSQAMRGNQNARGYKRPREEKKAISQRMKGNQNFKGRRHSEEAKRKLSLAHTGLRFSPEHRQKISESKKGQKLNLSEEERERRSQAWKSSQNPMWTGGQYRVPYPRQFNSALKTEVRERDENKCVLCGSRKELRVHHIDYDKQNSDSFNLITLCNHCHLHTNFDRDSWKEGFQGYMKKRGA